MLKWLLKIMLKKLVVRVIIRIVVMVIELCSLSNIIRFQVINGCISSFMMVDVVISVLSCSLCVDRIILVRNSVVVVVVRFSGLIDVSSRFGILMLIVESIILSSGFQMIGFFIECYISIGSIVSVELLFFFVVWVFLCFRISRQNGVISIELQVIEIVIDSEVDVFLFSMLLRIGRFNVVQFGRVMVRVSIVVFCGVCLNMLVVRKQIVVQVIYIVLVNISISGDWVMILVYGVCIVVLNSVVGKVKFIIKILSSEMFLLFIILVLLVQKFSSMIMKIGVRV